MTEQFQSWEFIQIKENHEIKKIYASLCSLAQTLKIC